MTATNLADVARCREDPGYTPAARAVPALIAALGEIDDDTAHAVERALCRAGAVAAREACTALTGAPERQRVRLLGLLARLSASVPDEAVFETLTAALSDESPRCRRSAIRALGNSGDPRAESALLSAVSPEAPLDSLRALAEALGKVGTATSQAVLARLPRGDAELTRRVERARLLIERREGRSTPGAIRLDRPLPGPSRVVFSCRRGLAEVLAAELAPRFVARVIDATRVEVEHSGSLEALLTARTALDVGLVVAIGATHGSESPAEHIAATLTDADTLARLAAWTDGTPRFRIEWTSGGHQRALAWAVAEQVAARSRAVVNDPRAASWTARVDPREPREIVLVPRLDPDPRFTYRVSDVPAASHPTIAAALVRYGGTRADDVVWDPFVGSGLELVERALLGPYARLLGSDVDARAVAAALKNLTSAGVAGARIVLADARQFNPGPVSLIVTNPPMGRRVARDGSLDVLLDAVVARAGELLVPGGRLVWLSPLERRTERAARAARLHVTSGPSVDMGGFDARVQIFERRA